MKMTLTPWLIIKQFLTLLWLHSLCQWLKLLKLDHMQKHKDDEEIHALQSREESKPYKYFPNFYKY